jgi:hypothetical protein
MKSLFLYLVTLSCLVVIPCLADSNAKETKEIKEEKTEKEKTYANPNRIRFGASAGLSFSNAALEPNSSSSGKTGVKAGVLAETPLIPGFLYFQPEFNFVQKGAENDHFGAVIATRLNYLELPLLAKVRINLPRIRPFALAGPSLSYLLNASGENGAAKVVTENFSTVDVSMNLGAGLSFQISDDVDSSEVVFGMRYGFVLNDVDSGAGSWKSSTFQLTLGILL